MKVSKAIVNDRRVKIMRLIEEKRSVSVDELVEKYHVSPITIRRDLQYWEDKGAIIRNYGGASLIQEFVEDEEYERDCGRQSPKYLLSGPYRKSLSTPILKSSD